MSSFSRIIVRRPKVRTPKPLIIQRTAKPTGWRPPSILPIVKTQITQEEFNKCISSVSGFVSTLTKDMEGIPSEFYDYQIQHMQNDADFRNILKARQVGFSYTFAAESLSKCHLKNLQTSIFISYNQEEANEKIRFARALYESMPTKYQKKLVVDNKQSLEFEHKGRKSRILSFAQRQPRGKGNNTDVYLDEIAHMMWAHQIYVASLPVISRGTGVLTTASTPLGKNNLHYDISTDLNNYFMFSQMLVYWWSCPELCVDVIKARKLAPKMQTEDRVERFATQKLKMLYYAMDISDFMQEYELYYADESLSYYPLDLIHRCVFDVDNEKLEKNIDPEEISVGWAPINGDSDIVSQDTIMNLYADKKFNWYFGSVRAVGGRDPVGVAKQLIDNFAVSMKANNFGRTLLVGIDIGRKRDTSEISIMEQVDLGTHNLHIERLAIELENVKFREQKTIMRHILNTLPVHKMRIDSTGVGLDIAETLEEESSLVEGIVFNMENKSEIAKNFRFRLEDRAIALFNDANSIKQIHSIKRTATEGSQVKYGTEKSTRGHHGDKFWAKALASSAGDGYDRSRILGSIIKVGDERIFANERSKVVSAQRQPIMVPLSSVKAGVKPDGKGIRFENPMWNMFADNVLHEV